jgi:uncharacterized protein YueI
MSWGLELAAKEYAQQMQEVRIEVNIPAHTPITPETAMVLQRGLTTDKYRKIIRDAINTEQAKRKAKQQAKQSKLFE